MRAAILCVISACLAPAAARGQVTVRFLAPGMETTPVAGATKESFDALAVGSYSALPAALGTYTATTTSPPPAAPTVNVVAASNVSGANGTRSLTVPGSSSATLDLAQPAGYFGLYLTAADDSNRFEFFQKVGAGYVLLSTFNYETLRRSGLLTGMPGTSGGHYGNPDPAFAGQNNGEAYVYLNFYADAAADKFDRIVFTQVGSGGLESDNHVLSTNVFVPGQQVGTLVPVPVPEPAGVLLAAAVFMAGRRVRRR